MSAASDSPRSIIVVADSRVICCIIFVSSRYEQIMMTREERNIVDNASYRSKDIVPRDSFEEEKHTEAVTHRLTDTHGLTHTTHIHTRRGDACNLLTMIHDGMGTRRRIGERDGEGDART